MEYQIVFKDRDRYPINITKAMFESLFENLDESRTNITQGLNTLIFGVDSENNNKLILDKNSILVISKIDV